MGPLFRHSSGGFDKIVEDWLVPDSRLLSGTRIWRDGELEETGGDSL